MTTRQDNILTKKASPQTQYGYITTSQKSSHFYIFTPHSHPRFEIHKSQSPFFPALLANIFSYTKKHKLLFGHITKKAYLCTR